MDAGVTRKKGCEDLNDSEKASKGIKDVILKAINLFVKLEDYSKDDCIFSQKYRLSPAAIAYILLHLSKVYNFKINDEFVDELEMCSFGKLEELLAGHAKAA